MSVTLDVKGMSCEHCVANVTKVLKGLAGVTSVDVSLENNSAKVEHDGSVAFEVMANAIEEAGFEASLAS